MNGGVTHWFRYPSVDWSLTWSMYKHSVRTAQETLYLGYKNSQLMLYREIIADFSEIHAQHIKVYVVTSGL